MHLAVRQTSRSSIARRMVLASLFALGLVTIVGVVTLRSEGGPYAPLICQGLTTSDWWWWYYECWLPPDPASGKAS